MSITGTQTTPITDLTEEQLLEAFREVLAQLEGIKANGDPMDVIKIAQQSSQTLLLLAIYKRLGVLLEKE